MPANRAWRSSAWCSAWPLTEGLSNHARRAAATPGARAAEVRAQEAPSGIDLIVLTENDLGCLERVFARWLDES